MTIGRNGQNLIFLISQPRAGSTLFQQMLAKHPDIHTTAEPWTMLHSVYGLRKQGYEAEYNAQSAWLAVNDFIQQLPDQRASYIEGLRLMHTHLYNAALTGTGCSYFLDKTPRYYHIIPELYEIFPEATFIFLLRNPLAVACSVMDTWVKGKWFKLHKYRADLLDAPQRLVDGMQRLGDRHLVVNYDQLLLDPDAVINDITQHLAQPSANCPHDSVLGSPRHASLTSIEQDERDASTTSSSVTLKAPVSREGFGYKDQGHVFFQGAPDKTNRNKWIRHLQDPQKWRLLNDYYHALGEDTIRALGTDPAELKSLLDAHRPLPLQRVLTVSLDWATKKPTDRQTIPYETYGIKLVRLFQRQGFWGGLWRSLQKVSPVRMTSQ
jgi:hypothetical protein